MRAFVVLGVVFSVGERLRSDLFCVNWDVKPQLRQSINQDFSDDFNLARPRYRLCML